MNQCKTPGCGSYAINHNCHGRDGSDGDLCDVCYWRKRASQGEQASKRVALTDEQDRALCEAFCNDASDEYFNARPASDSTENRRIFYAGHRKAWIARAIEAHITGENHG